MWKSEPSDYVQHANAQFLARDTVTVSTPVTNLNVGCFKHTPLSYCEFLQGQSVFGRIDLPIIMQTMFIIQLYIIPDKMLLGNRDTFVVRERVGEKIIKVSLTRFVRLKNRKVNYRNLHTNVNDSCLPPGDKSVLQQLKSCTKQTLSGKESHTSSTFFYNPPR